MTADDGTVDCVDCMFCPSMTDGPCSEDHHPERECRIAAWAGQVTHGLQRWPRSPVIVFCRLADTSPIDCTSGPERDFGHVEPARLDEAHRAAFAQLRSEGWHCDDTGEYCPAHRATEREEAE